jgi:predicted secreted hydrolase
MGRQALPLLGIAVIVMVLLPSCGFPGLVSTSAQLAPVSERAIQPTLPPIHLPQDEGMHNDLTEWWYYTGHLEGRDATGQTYQYGFELVVFQARRSTLPAVYPAHFAISDITRGEFHYDQRHVSRIAGGTAGTKTTAANASLDVHVGDWSIQSTDGHDHLAAGMKDYAINLDLVGEKPAILHNGNGLITYGLPGVSYYYSRTRMGVEGTVMDHDQPVQVTGLAWTDHQWGNFVLPGGGAWDWYSIQLNDNTEMMVYFIRDASGKITSYVGYVASNGENIVISPTSVNMTVLGAWQSPTTGITYPEGWQLDVNDSQLYASLTLIPLLKNQELVTLQSTGNVYWEGAVAIEGQSNGQAVSGQGYVELTGYAMLQKS